MKGDSSSASSSIPPRVIMIHDVRSCYIGKIGEIDDFELRNAYYKLCENKRLKEKHKIFFEKGLTHALNFLMVFKVEWLTIILSWVNEIKFELEDGKVRIKK